MSVKLRDVNQGNWRDCISLEMSEEQNSFVAPNLFTVAEWNFEKHYILKAICLNDKVIGMLAYCRDDEDGIENLYWLFRLMIDSKFQGAGYGKNAVALVIAEMRALNAAEIRTMHHPSNVLAQRLYKGLGFQPIGIDDDGDILLKLENQLA